VSPPRGGRQPGQTALTPTGRGCRCGGCGAPGDTHMCTHRGKEQSTDAGHEQTSSRPTDTLACTSEPTGIYPAVEAQVLILQQLHWHPPCQPPTDPHGGWPPLSTHTHSRFVHSCLVCVLRVRLGLLQCSSVIYGLIIHPHPTRKHTHIHTLPSPTSYSML